MSKPHKYTEEQKQFIRDNIAGTPYQEMADMFNEEFGTNLNLTRIKAMIKRLGLKNGRDGTFKKGRTPFNKGKKYPGNINSGSFSKGNVPACKRPIGSERFSKDGYLEVKVSEPNEWDLKHRVVWRESNGEIPKGYAIVFADGDSTNLNLDNLVLVSRAELLLMNQYDLISDDAELTKTGALVARVLDKTYKAKRKVKEK